MAKFNFKDMVNLYVPYTMEEQIQKFSNRGGAHILDYRMKPSTSEMGVKGASSYMFEGIPFEKIEGMDRLIEYDQIFPKRIPRKVAKNFQMNPQPVDHPSGDNHYYFVMYTDILIENTLDKLPLKPKAKPTDPDVFHPYDIYLSAYSGYYLIMRGGAIVGYSKAMEKKMKDYFARADQYSGDFRSNMARVSPQELFGSDHDKNGVRGTIYQNTPHFLQDRIGDLGWIGNVTVSNFAMGASIAGNFAYGGDVWVILESNDPLIGNLGLTFTKEIHVLDIATEGGGESKTTETNSNRPPDVTVRPDTRNRRLYGTAIKGKTLVITFPGGISKTVIVEGEPQNVPLPNPGAQNDPLNPTINAKLNLPMGEWSVEWPPSVDFKTHTELSKIAIRYSEDLPDENTKETHTFIEPTIIKDMGLPVLKAREGKKLLSSTYPSEGKKIKFGAFNASTRRIRISDARTMKYFYLGFIMNPKRVSYSTTMNNYFNGMPSSALNSPAVSFLLTVGDGEAINTYHNFPPIDLLFNIPDPTPQSLSAAYPWTRARAVQFNSRYRTTYRRSWIPQTMKYVTKYRRGADKVKKFLRYSTKWDSGQIAKNSIEYRTLYRSNSEEVTRRRSFYIFAWENKKGFTRSLRYSSKWYTTKSRTKSLEYKTTWSLTQVEPVMLIPYYVRDKTDGTSHNISFQVYGNPEKLQDYVADDNILFYFSNPSKYEIVKFDYNMNPYGSVFLTGYTDDTLSNRDGVPENYHLLGNYTIKGIDLINSVSLDVVVDGKQVSLSKSYWLPIDIEDWADTELVQFADKSQRYSHRLDERFRDDHHEDIVELDLIILNEQECCFTQKSSGSRCSPY